MTLSKRLHPGLGSVVRRLRHLQGITLQVMACRGATTPQTIVQLENFDLATPRTLNRVAKGLGVTTAELLAQARGER